VGVWTLRVLRPDPKTFFCFLWIFHCSFVLSAGGKLLLSGSSSFCSEFLTFVQKYLRN